MLTDKLIVNAKPTIGADGEPKACKLRDRDGMYLLVTAAGARLFRYDYRVGTRRETLALGKYDPNLRGIATRDLAELEYGMSMSLAEARLLLTRARRSVEAGQSPSKAKVEAKTKAKAELTFGGWADKYFENANIAESTRAMRRSIYRRDVEGKFGNMQLGEITPHQVKALCEKIKKDRDAPATAIHVREIVKFVFNYARDESPGTKIENPADEVKASSIATFKPRERALSPDEIRLFFTTVDTVGTMPQLRLGLKLLLLTAVRKGELLGAKWNEMDFEARTWTIPAERMKARRAHVVYLSDQAHDLLVGLHAVVGASPFILPGRYNTDAGMTPQALNRVIEATIAKAAESGITIEHFGPHDLRRSFSTLMHECGHNSDVIEKCLAHVERSTRAVYNVAKFEVQRRRLMETWSDMTTAFIAGTVTTSSWKRIIELMGEDHSWSEALAMIQAEPSQKRRAA